MIPMGTLPNNKFNIRVYGILLNAAGEVLLSHEEIDGFGFTKFPGGGLEWGEGLVAGLVREFMEEAGLEIEVLDHLYTTDFFQPSAFNPNDQLISVYYHVRSVVSLDTLTLERRELVEANRTSFQHFSWKSIAMLEEQDVTFPIDRKVVSLLKQRFS